jgi:hypothetical protein
LRPCNANLRCGHVCGFKCHSDDPDHRAVKCFQECTRLCTMGHPCNRKCSEECGPCQFPAYQITLPCGHVKEQTTWYESCCTLLAGTDTFILCSYLSSHRNEIECDVLVKKDLPTCEHIITMKCTAELSSQRCQSLCDKILPCCGRTCSSKCHECQDRNKDVSATPGEYVNHAAHKCGKDLRCGHPCADLCTPNHSCSGQCKAPCRQSCSHRRCEKGCSGLCGPCLEPCPWTCEHYTCPLPCGSVRNLFQLNYPLQLIQVYLDLYPPAM